MGKNDDKRSSSILNVFSGLRGKPKEEKKTEKAEETPSIARQSYKGYGSLALEPTKYRYGEPAPSYEYAQAEAYAEQERRNLNNRIENVDGADFQTHFRQLQVSGQETTVANDKTSRVDVREVAVQDLPKRSENSSKDGAPVSLQARYETEQQRKQENEAEGQNLYRSENFDKSEFTEGAETALMHSGPNVLDMREGQECVPEITTVQVHYTGEAKQTKGDDESLSLLGRRIREWDFKLHEVLPPYLDPFGEVEAAQLGFVQYLFNKATAEIEKGDVEAANPCIERLRSIHGAENVISALEDEIYGRVIEEGVSKLAQGDKDSALQILDSIKDPRFLKYQRILEQEIMDFMRRVAGRNIFNSNYKEFFHAISDLREYEKIWGTFDFVLSGPDEARGTRFSSSRLVQLAAYHIRDSADKHIRAGEFVKAVSLLSFLQESPDYKWSICIDLSRKFLQMANDSVGREELELMWSWLLRVDKTLEIASSLAKSISTDTDLVEMVFNSPYDSWAVRIAIINRRWDRLDRDIVGSRNSILCRARQIYEKRVYIGLDEQNIRHAYQNLLNLEVFWRPQKTDQNGQTNGQEVKVAPTSDQRILKLFLSSRQRSFKIDRYHAGKDTRVYEEEKMTEINLPTDSSLGFVYCLTNAEIFYFEKRSLENALVWCQKAVEIADENVPHWASKSDALYLLARIFTRKNMPLDADYHYSLIPSFEKYDQWRIYGEPGRLLRDVVGSAKLDRGKLNLKFEDVMLIVTRITQNLATTATAQAESDETRYQARYLEDIIRALYADDISWSEHRNLRFELLSLEDSGTREKASAASRSFTGHGPFLHLLSLAGPLEYLRIALHNPWVDVEQQDNEHNTPIHQAATAFDKEKISLLLERGANPAAVNSHGNSPLHRMLLFPEFKLRSAQTDVKGALSLFVRAPVESQRPDGSKIMVFLLLNPNHSGETPIELMRKTLIQDLRQPEAATEIGYLAPFKEAWELISKLAHCPQTYLDDSIFERPAMRERELKTALKKARFKELRQNRAVESRTLAQSQSPSPPPSPQPSPPPLPLISPPLLPPRARKREREPVRAQKPKRFGIF